MTIKVIGAGYGRNGTMSLKLALEKLGFDKCYHMMVLDQSKDEDLAWLKLHRGEQVDFERRLDDVEVKEGGLVTLNVEVSSESAANLVWHKDGQAIDRSNADFEFRSEGRKHSLIIKTATVHHEGEFVASVGEQECSCELTVVGKCSKRKSVT